jgi:hypothetical protein
MDQSKKPEGQQNWDKQKRSQGQQQWDQQKQQGPSQKMPNSWESQNPNREPAEGSRDTSRGNQPGQMGGQQEGQQRQQPPSRQSPQERGRGTQSDRRAGISNRDMDSGREQDELPERSSER